MDYVTRYKISPKGIVKDIRIPKKEAEKLIDKILKEDKKMLAILADL